MESLVVSNQQIALHVYDVACLEHTAQGSM